MTSYHNENSSKCSHVQPWQDDGFLRLVLAIGTDYINKARTLLPVSQACAFCSSPAKGSQLNYNLRKDSASVNAQGWISLNYSSSRQK